MRGLFSGIREGYREERARLGAPRPFFEWRGRPPEAKSQGGQNYHIQEAAPPTDGAVDWMMKRIAELEAAGHERSAEMAELADYAEQMKARIAELESAPVVNDLYAEVLRLPGAETMLRNKYHPDKHPKADDAERRALNEATQKVNAAYSEMKRAEKESRSFS